MTLTRAEQEFLGRQHLGYLATIGPDGGPQVKPLGFSYNAELGTIDIGGFRMTESAKYRNVQARPQVAFVTDEISGEGMDGVHFLEIRGTAETTVRAEPGTTQQAAEIIRIQPTRVVSFNVDPAEPGLRARKVSSE